MRILSLLPAATEIIYLLGLEKNLVGVTDDCDYPKEAKKLPKVTNCLSPNYLSSKEIDEKVKKLGHMGLSIAHLNQDLLKKLNPDLILTQDICSVCAISYSEIKKAARILDSDTKIISLEPESVEDILLNILLVGEYTGHHAKSRKIVQKMRNKVKSIKEKVKNLKKPKVLVIEWLDPIMVAGHWAPEMVELARGKCLVSKPGKKSVYVTHEELKKLDPDIVIIAPCGFNINRALREKKLINDFRLMINESKFFLMDGNSYLTRPGPRVIDGVEIFSEILHPEIFKRTYPKKDWIEFDKLHWKE